MCAEGWLAIEVEHIREAGLSTLYLPLQRQQKISVEQLTHRPCGKLFQFYLFLFLPVRLFFAYCGRQHNNKKKFKKKSEPPYFEALVPPILLTSTRTGFRLRALFLPAVVIMLLPFRQTQI